MFLKMKLIILITSLLVGSTIWAADVESQAASDDEILVAFIDWHHVMVAQKILKVVQCGADIIVLNLGDIGNLFLSGMGILGKSIAGQKLFIESIVKDFPKLAPYENAMYECQEQLEEPIEETLNAINRMKKRGVTLVLASNMSERQFENYKKSKKADLLALFDIYHIANEENGKKPHKKYYVTARAKVDKKVCDDKDECAKRIRAVFTDDLPENIDGAHQADVGIDAFLFKKETVEKEFERRGFFKREETSNKQ